MKDPTPCETVVDGTPIAKSAADTTQDSDASIKAERNSSFLSCVMNLGMTAMGLGVLGMPVAFSQMGYIVAPIIAIAFAIFSDISFIFLVRVCERIDRYSYDLLSKHYLGFWGVRYTNWAFILQLFFVVVAFLTIPMSSVEKLIQESYTDVGCTTNAAIAYKDSHPTCSSGTDCPTGENCFLNGDALASPFGAHICDSDTKGDSECRCSRTVIVHRFIIGAVITVFTAALGFVLTLHGITPVATTAFFCLLVAVILFFVVFADSRDADFMPTAWPADAQKAVAGVGTLCLAYNSQYQVIACQKEMKQPKHIDKLAHLTMFGMCMPLYILIGMTGMFVGENIASNVFESLGSSPAATAGRWLVCIMVVMKIPLVFNPMRDYMFAEFEVIPGFKKLYLRNPWHRGICSVSVAVLAFVFSWFLPLGLIFDFSGALLMAPASFILPALYIMQDANMYGRESGTYEEGGFWWHSDFTVASKRRYVLAILLNVAGAFSVIVGTVTIIYNLTDDPKNPC